MTDEAKRKGKKASRNAGQIIQRGRDSWLVRIYRGEDEAVRCLYMNTTIRGKKKNAQDYVNKTLTAISTGTFVQRSRLSLGQYLDRWLETCARPRVRERTFADYKALLERYVREPLGKKMLADVRAVDIQGVYKSMQGRGLSPRVVRYTHAVLSSALKQAVKWDLLSRNPAALVDLPRMVRKEMQALSAVQTTQLLDALRNTRLYALFAFALASGMRPQEYLGLKWTDVDLDRGTATVRRVITWSREKGGGWKFSEPKTSRSRRTIPLPASIVRTLVTYKRRQAEERLRAGLSGAIKV
jgi:integrase